MQLEVTELELEVIAYALESYAKEAKANVAANKAAGQTVAEGINTAHYDTAVQLYSRMEALQQ